jgi:hypothetical protein
MTSCTFNVTWQPLSPSPSSNTDVGSVTFFLISLSGFVPNVTFDSVSFSGTAIAAPPPPEIPAPAALPLFATGIGGLGMLGWRRKRRAQAVA